MQKRFVIGSSLAALALSACGALNGEFKFSKDEGIPKIDGKYEVTIPQDFVCGNPIQIDAAKGYTVTTAVEGTDACAFTFKQDVEVIKQEDYEGPHGSTLAGVKLVKRVEIEVATFELKNGETGAAIDLNTAIRSLSVKVHGKEILDKEKVTKNLPGTFIVDGEPLNKVKSDINAKKPVILPVDASIVIPNEGRPTKLAVNFEAQPALVMGGGF